MNDTKPPTPSPLHALIPVKLLYSNQARYNPKSPVSMHADKDFLFGRTLISRHGPTMNLPNSHRNLSLYMQPKTPLALPPTARSRNDALTLPSAAVNRGFMPVSSIEKLREMDIMERCELSVKDRFKLHSDMMTERISQQMNALCIDHNQQQLIKQQKIFDLLNYVNQTEEQHNIDCIRKHISGITATDESDKQTVKIEQPIIEQHIIEHHIIEQPPPQANVIQLSTNERLVPTGYKTPPNQKPAPMNEFADNMFTSAPFSRQQQQTVDLEPLRMENFFKAPSSPSEVCPSVSLATMLHDTAATPIAQHQLEAPFTTPPLLTPLTPPPPSRQPPCYPPPSSIPPPPPSTPPPTSHTYVDYVPSTPMKAPVERQVQLYSSAIDREKKATTTLDMNTFYISPLADSPDKVKKTYKFKLRSRISISLNGLSTTSGIDLMHNIDIIKDMLRGNDESFNNSICSVEVATEYCKSCFAFCIYRQAIEQVANSIDTVHVVAALVVSICAEFPDVLHLLLAYLYSKQPALIPLPVEMRSAVPLEAKHTTGMARLFSAIMIANPPIDKDNTYEHPFPMNLTWGWLADCARTPPVGNGGTTAIVLYEVLSVCGYKLKCVYGLQFLKLCRCFQSSKFLARLKADESPESMCTAEATIARLGVLLQAITSNEPLELPRGLMSPDFWDI